MTTAPRYPTTPMCNGTILERFEPTARDTDVFTATIAKCGQTWLTTVLYHLKTRGQDPDYGGQGLMRHVPWLEIPFDPVNNQPYDVDARLAEIAASPDPRIFKMHVIWEEIPRPPGSRSKVITVSRDPRDVPYSMYSHLAGMKVGPFADGAPTFEAYFEQWWAFGYYYKFIHSFWPHRDDPDLLWLRFEDMKADLAGEARKITDFLGWERSDAEVAHAAALSQFDRMQTHEATHFGGREPFKHGRFFREGAVGKNRAMLTGDMERRIVERARQEFEPACFEWVMSQGV